MEEGFRTPPEYTNLGMKPHVSLFNSILSAESPRISAYLKGEDNNLYSKDKNYRSDYPLTKNKIQHLPTGHILVWKVFYPGSQLISIEQTKDAFKQKTWNVQDPGLILPEYLVEFEYSYEEKGYVDNTVTFETKANKNKEVNKVFTATIEAQKILQNTYLNPQINEGVKGTGFHISAEDLDRWDMGWMKKVFLDYLKSWHVSELIENNFKFPDEESKSSRTAIENSLPPEIPNRPKFETITQSLIKSWTRETNFEYIKYLNLFNNDIRTMEKLSSLTNLVTLILSFNLIKQIEGIENLVNLKKLDLNHNFISKIEGISNLKELNILNLANNWISDIQDLEQIADDAIPLNELSLKCNPLAANESYRTIVLQSIPYLKKLDGILLSEKDREDDTETVMTKEIIYSAINSSASPPEIGSETQNFGVEKSENFTPNSDSPKDIEFIMNPEVLIINHLKIKRIQNLEGFTNLRRLTLIDNLITKIEGIESWRLLEELSLEKNKISKIEGIGHLQYLKKLDLGSNSIKTIENLERLENLTQLSLEDNEIEALTGLTFLLNLLELYIGNNWFTNMKQVVELKKLPKLIILDISGNEMWGQPNYRIYIIFHLKKKLKVLDGMSIEASEIQQANEMFSGRLTDEILETRWATQYFNDLKELDISSCKLRDFEDMFDESKFPNLRELNLSHNNLITLKGFGYLPKLKILTVSANKLETLISSPNEDGYPKGLLGLTGLEVLDISYNNITDLYGLNFAPMKDLKILNASNNNITKLEHIDHLKDLREVDLSNNRIRQFESNSFNPLHQIAWLRIEDNGLKTLNHIDKLERLQFLFLHGNRISDFWDVEKLENWPKLMELSLSGNPIFKKPMYRASIIKRLPGLLILDTREITSEERERIESVMSQDSKMPPMIHFSQFPTAKVPVKLNAVNFDGVFNSIKVFQDQPSPGVKGYNHNTTGSSRGNRAGNNGDMTNLIHVSSINTEYKMNNSKHK
jgi:Leucine-rich repeat (LRR) protein